MRSLPLALALALVAGLLAGCRTGRIVGASPASSPLAQADGRVPPAADPTAFVACAADGTGTYYGSCRPVNPRSSPLGEVYAGVQAVAFPAWGPAVTFGQVFSRTSLATWSFEVDAAWQDLDSEIGGKADGGQFAQIRGGLKAEFLPCRRGHPTLRAGIGWFRTTGETDWVDNAADYVAFHVGLGYEYAVTPQFTTGPELVGILAAEEKGFDLEFAPQVRWHFIWKF